MFGYKFSGLPIASVPGWEFFGTFRDDTFTGTAGDDTMHGSGGADRFDGGIGSDTVNYKKSSLGVVVDLQSGTGSLGQAQGDTYSSVENVVGSDHDDTIRGSSADNHLVGGDGNDTISTVGGTNTVDAGAGSDTNFAGGLRNTIDAGSGDDRVFGSDGVDTIDLGLGDDWVRAGDGADTIHGGEGDDIIGGGDDGDDLDGGTGSDTVSYVGSSAGVTVDLETNMVSGGAATGDTISNFENILGSSFDDRLSGDENANVIEGGFGDDILEGKGGADIFKFRSDGEYRHGNDTILDFQTGKDQLDFTGLTHIASYEDLEDQGRIEKINGDLIIDTTYPGSSFAESITLTGIEELSEADFIF